MSPSEFLALANETLDAIEDAVSRLADASDLDLEASRTGNVLGIEFGDGAKIVVNIQEPMQELWVAARAGGFHYRWNGHAWADTREGTELFEALSSLASRHAGAPVVLRG